MKVNITNVKRNEYIKKEIQSSLPSFEEFVDGLFDGIDLIPESSAPFVLRSKLYKYFEYKIIYLQLDNKFQILCSIEKTIIDIDSLIVPKFGQYKDNDNTNIKSQMNIYIDYLSYELHKKGIMINKDEIYIILEKINSLTK